jgi:hypothetical protein
VPADEARSTATSGCLVPQRLSSWLCQLARGNWSKMSLYDACATGRAEPTEAEPLKETVGAVSQRASSHAAADRALVRSGKALERWQVRVAQEG